MTKKHPKTIAALQREDATAWDVCDAIAEECAFTGEHGEIKAVADEVLAAGIDLSIRPLTYRYHAARVLRDSSKTQAVLMKASHPSAIGQLASAGFSPEAIVDEVKKRPRGAISRHDATAIVKAHHGKPERPENPEDWTDAEWDRFDKATAKAVDQFMRALRYKEAGIYTPGVEVALKLEALRPNVDWDAELADLTGGAR
jgi:hypothetical protein